DTCRVEARLARRTDPARAGAVAAPEQVERAIEDRDLIRPVHQQRPARVIDLGARGEVDELERGDDVEQAAGGDGDAGAAEHRSEEQQVADEMRHAPGTTRVTACARWRARGALRRGRRAARRDLPWP